MIPKGFQLTIPWGLVGTPLKVLVYGYIESNVILGKSTTFWNQRSSFFRDFFDFILDLSNVSGWLKMMDFLQLDLPWPSGMCQGSWKLGINYIASWLTSSYFTGVIELYMNGFHFGGIKHCKMYGDFEGFPVLQCIVWIGNTMNPV